uniref:Single-stranded DNA-binding protein n=1 Tax=Anopheles atroparvus TaxID=41427 RepID=A0A182IUX3_ANOAO
MDYDSDSELHATDTLRLDSDSEDENLSHPTPAQESIAENDSPAVSVAEGASDPSNVPTEHADESIKSSDNETEQPQKPQSRRIKVSKIIDSDSEEGDDVPEKAAVAQEDALPECDGRTTDMNRLKSLLDSDSDTDEQVQRSKHSPPKRSKKKKTINRPEPGTAEGYWESDEERKEAAKPGSKPKRKKQTGSTKTASTVATAKDMLASLNLFFDDDEDDQQNHEPNTLLNSVSDDDSDIGNSRVARSPVQKMTEKQALEERQIIQSESQRMAREAYIDVPYHRTKAYSLEEFLARKTIRKPDPTRDCLGKSSDLSIKMTPEQLEMFARQLKERELESQEFFKSESESSDEEPKKDDAPSAEVTEDKESSEVQPNVEPDNQSVGEFDTQEKKSPIDPNAIGKEATPVTQNVEPIDDPIDEIVNRTSENMETLISNMHETEPSESGNVTETAIQYDLIPAAPNETIVTKKASMLAKLNLPPCPRLSGHSDMLIDLESGTLEPKEPSGANILFQRLAKCSGSARKSVPSKSTITVLSTDDGVVKLDKISLFTEEERPLVHKEPIPGAAYLKLKQALKEKIDNDRRAAMRKREEEYAKRMEIEKEEMGYETDEDEEELLEDEEENKLTSSTSSKRNEENGENSSLLWAREDKEELPDDDLIELCSGRFATQLPPDSTQMPTQISNAAENHLDLLGKESPTRFNKPLYTQAAEQSIDDSQLMELCSGRFETQLPVPEEPATQVENATVAQETVVSDNSDIIAGGKLRLDSSDDEVDHTVTDVPKKSKKRKRKLLHVSDDEDETEHPEADSAQDHDDIDELGEEKDVKQDEEEAERYVDYDSEENEVEVKLTKKEKKQIVANFVENEAELSESEWGSADEDEKDLDRYDIELADEEQYDQSQLQQELEKIHNRQMLDQDNREVEQLKEFFLEDEENDGVGRVRQFRWKNVEKTFSLDYDKQKEGDNENEEGVNGEASDDETELVWRKMRHERYLLMKEQNVNGNETELAATTLLNPEDTMVTTDVQENNQSVCNISAVAKKKITIVKRTTTATTGKDSPFLISKSSVVQGHKASFLSRDAETLNKLANLVKSNPDTEGTSTVMAANGRNFVFTALSPAIEKTSKRSLDPEDAEEKANIKRAKTTCKETTSKKKLLLAVNSVSLLGRVGADPQRRGNDEHPVVMFSLATHSNYKYDSGDWMQKTDWHRVVVFKPGLRDAVMSYLKKGQRTMVTGKITYGEITDQEGKQRATTSIIADDVIFLQNQ